MFNGKDYVNLPADPNDPLKDMRWQELDRTTRAEPHLERLQSAQAVSLFSCVLAYSMCLMRREEREYLIIAGLMDRRGS